MPVCRSQTWYKMKFINVCMLTMFVSFCNRCDCDVTEKPVVVSTYSLWNLMYNWDVRKLRITQMIREQDPDVIAFQDVRGTSLDMSSSHSQITELQLLNPHYTYSDFHPLNKATYHKHSYLHYKYSMSGLGILSKHPIIRSSKLDVILDINTLEAQRNTAVIPKNRRVSILYYHLGVAGVGTINVIVTQLSKELKEQCESVAKIMQFIQDQRLHHVILLGDLNIHDSAHEEPVKVLTTFTLANKSMCHGFFANTLRMDSNLFVDAWAATHSRGHGYTYRDMNSSPKLISRPDRIMASQYAVQTVTITGLGQEYSSKYSVHLYMHRFWTIIGMAKDSYDGYRGYSCLHDCGLGAVCRCGVCVKTSEQHSCNIPYCDECSSTTYLYFCVAILMLIACSLSFLHAVLRGLLIVNSFHKYDLRTKLGFNCCLCHPELYAPEMGKYSRKLRLSVAFKIASCFLPPFQHLVVSGLGLVLISVVWRLVFYDIFSLVYNVPEAEWYPSNHLMVTAKVLLHPANRDNIL